MKTVKMKYGQGTLEVSVPEAGLLGVIEKNVATAPVPEEQVIQEALDHPIASPRIEDLVHPGQTAAIVVSDVTRAWQRLPVYLPLLLQRLNDAGIPDKNIRLICALGYHRGLTREEHVRIIGEPLARRFEILDHDCQNREQLKFLGTTKRGTPVWMNKTAMEADHLILTGACTYHPFVGFSGGKKSLLPGIAGFETIQANHHWVLGDTAGGGQRHEARNGNTAGNPVHEDMMDAGAIVHPSFLVNVIMGPTGKIAHAVAGAWDKAHEQACAMIPDLYGVPIPELSDLTIASQGGFPKDIEFYQTGKAFYHALDSVKPGGTLIVLSECREGLGPLDANEMFTCYDGVADREGRVRQEFSVPGYVSCYMCTAAENYDIIAVTSLDPALLKRTRIRAVKTVEEAQALVAREKGPNLRTWLMPLGSTVLPILTPKA
ncbi:MAG: nickel-dependent lactate racemase [Deltaproteobacteria bacterium]|nr:nickel-dependent lactate racemase [Deltaproteobacteria bacterium]